MKGRQPEHEPSRVLSIVRCDDKCGSCCWVCFGGDSVLCEVLVSVEVECERWCLLGRTHGARVELVSEQSQLPCTSLFDAIRAIGPLLSLLSSDLCHLILTSSLNIASTSPTHGPHQPQALHSTRDAVLTSTTLQPLHLHHDALSTASSSVAGWQRTISPFPRL